ncbi:hypothetical protein AALC25_17225 [Lachnospiraceae bacterium 29-84]
MKGKIAFVAVGQAAGNIGRLLEGEGYTVIYVNTSQEDLDTLEGVKFKYHIQGGEGCNKDRHKAKKLVIEDFDSIAAEIDSKAAGGMVFVMFASGGGTGSGAGPMLADLLVDEGKAVGIITILPAPDESIKSHINSYECFSELEKIGGTSACFIIDNARGGKMGLNHEFVEAFVEFLGIPENHRSVEGNIDKAEVMETLKAHGMAVVARSGGQGSAALIQAIKENALAPIEPDRAVKYIAAALGGGARMQDLEKAFGMPVDNFQTSSSNGSSCCLSGLSYPRERLDGIYGRVAESRGQIERNLAAAREAGLKEGVNFLDGIEPRREAGRKQQSKRDIMGKYL